MACVFVTLSYQKPLCGMFVEPSMSDFIDRLGIRPWWVVSNPECECAEGHRPTRVLHRNEHRAEATVRPRHVCLDAAAEHCPVLPLVVAGLESRLRDAAFAA